jgi:hypothetical protein
LFSEAQAGVKSSKQVVVSLPEGDELVKEFFENVDKMEISDFVLISLINEHGYLFSDVLQYTIKITQPLENKIREEHLKLSQKRNKAFSKLIENKSQHQLSINKAMKDLESRYEKFIQHSQF